MPVETYESLQSQIECLKKAIETESDKIKNLSKFYNFLQVRAWREHRRRMNMKLAYLEERLKLYK